MNVQSAKPPKVMPISINADTFRHNFPTGGASPSDGRDRRRSSSRNTTTTTSKTYPPVAQQSPGPVGTYQRPFKPNPNAKPLRVEDCLHKMIDFVKKHELTPIIGRNLSDEELEHHLRPQAEIAAQLPKHLGFLNRELAMQLAVMSLYDLAVLVDDSISMEFEEEGRRKVALKRVLYFLADMYGAVSDEQRGIRAIRFLNGSDESDKADDLRRPEEIDSVIDSHEFEGLTRIGTGLMQKILKPFVFSDEKWVKGTTRKLQHMERPLLVMVITDGAVEGEPPKRLEQAIKSVVDSLQNAGIGAKAVAFQFARVGSDDDAKKFLQKLDDESKVADYVDTLSGGDIVEIMGLEGDTKVMTEKHQRKAIKLLLGPINPGYDRIPGEDDSDDGTNDDNVYNSADDFDDDEEDE